MWPPQMPTSSGDWGAMLFLPLPGTRHCGMKVLEDLCLVPLAFSSDIPSLSLFQYPCILEALHKALGFCFSSGKLRDTET